MAKKSFIKDLENLLGESPEKKAKQVSGPDKKSANAKKNQKQKTGQIKYLTSNIVEVELGEKLNIDHADKLKEIILKNLGNSESIEFHSANCESMDLTFIQLIHSLGKMAEKNKKKVIIEIPIQEEQKELFENAGINRNAFISIKNNAISVNIGNKN